MKEERMIGINDLADRSEAAYFSKTDRVGAEPLDLVVAIPEIAQQLRFWQRQRWQLQR
jgi:hypothetical protein